MYLLQASAALVTCQKTYLTAEGAGEPAKNHVRPFKNWVSVHFCSFICGEDLDTRDAEKQAWWQQHGAGYDEDTMWEDTCSLISSRAAVRSHEVSMRANRS